MLYTSTLMYVLYPISAQAASRKDVLVAGWIPYWKGDVAINDAKKNIKKLDILYPFTLEVDAQGMLVDRGNMENASWSKLFATAKKQKKEVIPTILWHDADGMHTILSDQNKRKAHIDSIMNTVRKGKYIGIDIDYEGRHAETKDAYSVFLKELKKELDQYNKKNVLVCTLESRTPTDSLRIQPGKVREYSNDYEEINTYCDRVNIMTYDQARVDAKLNNARSGEPYVPVSDPDWARKVMQEALAVIDADKLFLGVPTYGYEYTVVVEPDWYKDYQKLWSFNPRYATDIAKELGVVPGRNAAGEMSITYFATSSPFAFLADNYDALQPKAKKSTKKKSSKKSSANSTPEYVLANAERNELGQLVETMPTGKATDYKIPANTPKQNIAAARALAYANKHNVSVTFNIAWWSDAGAIAEKVELARELGIAGIAIFKIDGGEDPKMWKVLP